MHTEIKLEKCKTPEKISARRSGDHPARRCLASTSSCSSSCLVSSSYQPSPRRHYLRPTQARAYVQPGTGWSARPVVQSRLQARRTWAGPCGTGRRTGRNGDSRRSSPCSWLRHRGRAHLPSRTQVDTGMRDRHCCVPRVRWKRRILPC